MATKKETTKAQTRQAPMSKKMVWLWVLVFLMFLGEALFYTWCRVQCVQVGYAITEETRRQQAFKTMNNSLKIELAHLKTPENISRIARYRLNLGMPDPKQIIVLP